MLLLLKKACVFIGCWDFWGLFTDFFEMFSPSGGGFELRREAGREGDGVVLADVAGGFLRLVVAIKSAEGAEGDFLAVVDGMADFLDGEGEDESHGVGGDA